MNSHLVTVEVGIEGRTCKWVELYSFAFNHARLEGLDAEAVERRGAVKKDRVVLHNVFENVPYDRGFLVDNLFGALDRFYNAAFDEFADDERFVELGSHIFRETAFVHAEFRADDNDGTCGVVDTFAEEVLAEAALFAFEGVGETLERAVGFAFYGRAATGIVK